MSTGTNICIIDRDLNNERTGFFRAFYTESLEAPTRCTVFGYCEAGHTFHTIKGAVHDFREYDKFTPVYYNNKQIA